MKICFWGTRGSVPTHGTDRLRFGGATTSLSIECAGRCWLIDGGTGIVEAGRRLNYTEFTVLQTHHHWDHIQGFPFFGPLFNPGVTASFHAVPRDGRNLEQTLREQMTRPNFPVTIDMFAAELSFHDLEPVGTQTEPELKLEWSEQSHPGGSTAFRFENADGCVVFTGDVEAPDSLESLEKISSGANVLIMDAQYFPDEYASRKGWGHSTFQHAVDLAIEAGVESLYLTHHDPAHNDSRLTQKVADAQHYAKGEVAVFGAYDGLSIDLQQGLAVAA